MTSKAIAPDRTVRATASPVERDARHGLLSRLSTVFLTAQPIVFAAAILMARASELSATPDSIVRPFIVLASLGGVLLLAGRVVTRSWTIAALISSAIILFTLREVIPATLLGVFALWWLLVTWLRRLRARPKPGARVPRAIARASGIFAWVSLVFWATTAWTAMNIQAPDVQTPEPAGPALGRVGGEPLPNIYLLLLDGYPSADTLEMTFGYDNTPFLEGLEDLGFDVPTGVRTNYNKTWLTLASMLNGQYVGDLMDGHPYPPESHGQLWIVQKIINRASMLDPLRDNGYRILTAPSPFSTAELRSAQDVSGHAALNQFEVRLIESSPWMLIFRDLAASTLMSSQRSAVLAAIDSAVVTARDDDSEPHFLFAHIHSPHTPFALGSDEPGVLPECAPLECTLWSATIEELRIDVDAYRSGLVAQIEHLNALVLDAVAEIVAEDPGAVVILMSDHGIRYSYADVDEHFRSFLATRTPGHAGLFSDGPAPVNLLRRLVSTYLSIEYPDLPYEAWQADWSQYLRLVPYEADG